MFDGRYKENKPRVELYTAEGGNSHVEKHSEEDSQRNVLENNSQKYRGAFKSDTLE